MNILLFASALKAQGIHILESLARSLREQGVSVAGAYSLDDLEDTEKSKKLSYDCRKNIDAVISIGGDGSLLKLAHALALPLPPFVGINLGSLGFLAEIPADNITSGIRDILNGSYAVSSRIIIEGTIRSHISVTAVEQTPYFAINECTIHRGINPNLVDIAVHVDGAYLNTFSCDGIIVSTPSGSTAYSLAAGGPILTPELNALVITPICPHTISNKPIVLFPKHSITLECTRGGSSFELSFDGHRSYSLGKGQIVEITVSSHRFNILSPHSGSDYFQTLRTKLGWTGSLRQ